MVAIPLRTFVFGAIVFIAYHIALGIWSSLPGDVRDVLHTILGLALLALFVVIALGLIVLAWERLQRLVHGPSAAELAKSKEDAARRRLILAHLEDVERRGSS